jgi:hypothetical protein
VAPNLPEPDALSRITLFRGVPILGLERLTSLLHERLFSAGSTVITADQPGEVVGEMSIADSLVRSADVATVEVSVLLWMDRVTFS